MDLSVLTETEVTEESKKRQRPNAHAQHIGDCKSSSVSSTRGSESEAHTLMKHSKTLTELV